MSERVPLSFLLVEHKDEHPPVEPVVPFAAHYDDAPKIVLAVLERTAILAEPSDRYERISVRHEFIKVDPADVEWRTKTATYEGARLNTEGRQRKAVTRSPWHASGTAPTPAQAQVVRAASDERALKNQQEIDKQKEREMKFLRDRAPKPTVPSQKEEAVITSTEGSEPADHTIPQPEKTKRCKRCRQEKPRSQFAATGIYGGYCSTCEPLEKAERAAARESAPKQSKTSNPRREPKVARPDANGSPAAARITDTKPVSASYDNVIRLLQKRDVLKAQLAEVQTQLQEAIATA